MSDTNTLDGMSIDGLRELARRAEAAAKVQEEAAKAEYVNVGKYRVRCSDGQISTPRGVYYAEASLLLVDPTNNEADLEEVIRILGAVKHLKRHGTRGLVK